jgi:hypothetical protein
MGAIGGGDGQIAGAAQAPLPVMAVHQAIVGTEGALIQEVVGRGDLRL